MRVQMLCRRQRDPLATQSYTALSVGSSGESDNRIGYSCGGVFVSEIQFAQTVAAEQEWRNDAGMTEAEQDAYMAEQMAELGNNFSPLGVQFAEWLMEPGRYRICNGRDLTEAMEDGDKQEEFLQWKAGK